MAINVFKAIAVHIKCSDGLELERIYQSEWDGFMWIKENQIRMQRPEMGATERFMEIIKYKVSLVTTIIISDTIFQIESSGHNDVLFFIRSVAAF